MSSPRFAHVGLTVSDLDRMIAFFTDMLGFELKTRLRPCDPGYMHWLVEVDDTAAAIDRAAGHGFLLVREPYLIAAGPNIGKTGTYLRHPDGFSLEIIGPRPQ
jgi:catechol 2,3-dioxygenase-like lactoylglutathione lyase family enzyme